MSYQPHYAPFNPYGRVAKHFEYPGTSLVQKLTWKLSGKIQTVAGPTVKGFDISQWNTMDGTDWAVKAYAAGYRFAFVKATEGTTWTDPKFYVNVPPLIDAGFLVSFYHLFRNNMSGVTQARFHMDVTANMRSDYKGRILPNMIDEETDDGVSVTTRILRFRDMAEMLKIVATPIVYSSPYKWKTLMGDYLIIDLIGDVAHWADAERPVIPGGWSPAMSLFWQTGIYPTYYWCPPVPGILKRVDTQLFLGTYEQLLGLVVGGSVPPAPPPEDDMDKIKIRAELDKIDQAQAVIELATAAIWSELEDGSLPPPPPPPPAPPPPAPSTVKMRVKVDKTKAWVFQVWNADKGKLVPKENEKGKPIMQEYEDSEGKRMIFALDTILTFKVGLVDANGDDDFMELHAQLGDHDERLFVLRQALGKLD